MCCLASWCSNPATMYSPTQQYWPDIQISMLGAGGVGKTSILTQVNRLINPSLLSFSLTNSSSIIVGSSKLFR